jgi:hypothetical protein
MPVTTELKEDDTVIVDPIGIHAEFEARYVGKTAAGRCVVETNNGSILVYGPYFVRRKPVKVTQYLILDGAGTYFFATKRFDSVEELKAFMHDEFPEESYIIAKLEFEQ